MPLPPSPSRLYSGTHAHTTTGSSRHSSNRSLPDICLLKPSHQRTHFKIPIHHDFWAGAFDGSIFAKIQLIGICPNSGQLGLFQGRSAQKNLTPCFKRGQLQPLAATDGLLPPNDPLMIKNATLPTSGSKLPLVGKGFVTNVERQIAFQMFRFSKNPINLKKF